MLGGQRKRQTDRDRLTGMHADEQMLIERGRYID